jgi:predicted nucleic-acid-binding Zn-ribbon protein
MEREITCLRCGAELACSGIYQFHEGKRYGVFGNLFELFVRKRSFEVYECAACGKVEFYVVK